MSAKLRVAVVGAGPAGIYAADILHRSERDFEVEIDLFERLPAPYGLVRYGVAPDHPRIKGIITALRQVLDEGNIRYFGNVNYGTDITLADLQRHYHAVIFATGAISDAPLNIPGINAAESHGAADFVNWFDGHPDVPRTWELNAEQVAVVGNGNVALDISRMLVKDPEELLATEIPENVYEGLRKNPLKQLHVFGRKGPTQVKFTPLELRELGEVNGVDMVLDERDFELIDDYLTEQAKSNKQMLVISRILGKWRDEQRAREAGEVPAANRQLHLHFWSKPVAVLLDEAGSVRAIKLQRTRPDGAGGVIDTDEFTEIPVQALYRAVGYFGSPLASVPFDSQRGIIPNIAGRVIAGADPAATAAGDSAAGDAEVPAEPVTGVYATGWIKRGPVGLIGATKSDAKETIDSLLADWQAGAVWQPEVTETEAIPALLAERSINYTTVEGWHRLDEHEIALGEAVGRPRIKVVPRDEMVAISNAAN